MTLVSPRRWRTISGPRKRIDSAIAAFSGAIGAFARPSVASASVRLCATVKAVIVFTSMRQPETISSSPSTNSRWSAPSRMCCTPSCRYDAARSKPLVAAPSVTAGDAGRSRWLSTRPSACWMRTSTSVIVVSRPSMRSVLPARPPLQVKVPRTSTAPGVSCCRSGVTRRQPSGTTGRDLDLDLAAGRALPQQRIGAVAGLAQLEVARARLVRAGQPRRADGEHEEQQPPCPAAPGHDPSLRAPAATSPGGRSITTRYFASKRS